MRRIYDFSNPTTGYISLHTLLYPILSYRILSNSTMPSPTNYPTIPIIPYHTIPYLLCSSHPSTSYPTLCSILPYRIPYPILLGHDHLPYFTISYPILPAINATLLNQPNQILYRFPYHILPSPALPYHLLSPTQTYTLHYHNLRYLSQPYSTGPYLPTISNPAKHIFLIDV